MTRRVLRLAMDGLVAVHAARAVHTALGGVSGVITAEVSMAGAVIEVEGPFDAERFCVAVEAALEPIGIRLVSVSTIQARALPLA